jgi:hypothetical protein
MSTRGETDAIVRRIAGYGRVFDDPPVGEDFLAVKMRMGALILEGFRELDKRLRSGEPLPEAWDPVTGYAYRVRTDYRTAKFIHAPGTAGGCHSGCEWVDKHAPVTVCLRCHTIRFLPDE